MTTDLALPVPHAGAPLLLCRAALRAPRLTRRLTAAHGALLLRSRGRVLAHWFGSPVLVLETVGRRSGVVRRVPLVYLPDGDDLAVVPANGGAARAPAWWLNLQAAGRAVAILGRERRAVIPITVDGDDHARLWRRFAATSPVEHYRRQAGRALPVVLLRADPYAATAEGAASRGMSVSRAMTRRWICEVPS